MKHYNLRTSTMLIRSFLPINPFYTNFLVERKDFTSKEISNKIAPFYFYSSLIITTLVIYKNVIHMFGIDKSQIALSSLYILNLIFIMNIKKRSFFMTRAAYFVSGFISTYDMVLRFYIAETKIGSETSDRKSSLQSLYRAFTCSLSCLVGQEIVLKTGSYEINLIISSAAQFVGLLTSIYTMSTNRPAELYKNLALGTILKSLTLKIFCAFLAGMICNCYNIFIKLFIHNILRETNKTCEKNDDGDLEEVSDAETTSNQNNASLKTTIDLSGISVQADSGNRSKHSGESLPKGDNSSTIIFDNKEFRKTGPYSLQRWKAISVNIAYGPIRLLSDLLIFIVTFFFPSYANKDPSKSSVEYYSKSGTLDAFVSFFCYFISDMIIGYSPEEYKQDLYIGSFFICSFSLLTMTYLKNRLVLACLYLTTSIFSKAASCYTKNFIVTSKLEKNLFIYSCLVESFLHVVVNKVCGFYKVNSIFKARVYGIMGLSIFLLIALIRLLLQI